MKLLSHRKVELPQPPNWINYEIGEHMIFSHRITEYTASTFPESLHFHDYYELVIYMDGVIRYICENKTLLPEPGDIIIAPPTALHTSTLVADSSYDRYVFYLYPGAFDACQGGALMQFLRSENRPYIYLKPENRREMISLLSRIEMTLAAGEPHSSPLAYSYILQLFHLINHYSNGSSKHDPHFPPIVMEIKGYIDENFAGIHSIAQVADHFFYSREYISRLFKRYLNTSIREYLQKRRITWAREQLGSTMPISDICQDAGFHSMSAFIQAFSTLTGMPPSHYRRLIQEDGRRGALPGRADI
ncbi:AraC family transcriptional regulator [Eubacteriales bacterium OttesenSCG-928-A19]|nr:AraC family transcriptional regulator [Eubacteriales bacterium OttesenSCG-928-A19]